MFWGLMIFGPIGVVLGLAELGLRFWGKPPTPLDLKTLQDRLDESARTEVAVITTSNLKGMLLPSPWEDVVYELKPNRRWIHYGVPVETNSRGFRGREYSQEKPPGTIRIIGVGDSVMFGWRVRANASYMSLLEGRLTGSGGPTVEVLNFGVPGYNTIQEAGLFREKGLRFEPDILLINYVPNDWQAPLYLKNPKDNNDLILRSELVRFLSRRLHRNVEKDDNLRHPRLAGGIAALDALGRIAAEHHVKVVLFIYPEGIEPESETRLKATAATNGFIWVDMDTAVREYYHAHPTKGRRDLWVAPDDGHPNEEGHRLIADTLEPVLAGLVKEAATAGPRKAP